MPAPARIEINPIFLPTGSIMDFGFAKWEPLWTRLIRIMILMALFSVVAACAAQEQYEAGGTSEVPNVQAAGSGENRIPSDGPTTSRPYVPGQVLVKFRNGIEAKQVERIQLETGLQTLKVASAPYLYLMRITDGSAVEDMLLRLKEYPEIVYAEPNYVRTLKGN